MAHQRSNRASAPRYEISIHREHPSGIGTVFINKMTTQLKPALDNSDFLNYKNFEWCVYDGSEKHNRHIKYRSLEDKKW